MSATKGMRHLVACGSPRARGRSAALARAVCEQLCARCELDEACLAMLSELNVAPCTGCGACQGDGACAIDDDMAALRARMDACDELTVVSPVYFAGPPAQLKCLLDRLQPYYHVGSPRPRKRPAHLYVVGDGGDPHGFAPLVATARSALAVAGFRLQDVHDWVGLLAEGAPVPTGPSVLDGGRVRPASAYRCAGPDEARGGAR